MKKTTVFKTAALLVATGLMVLAGCRNSVSPPSAPSDGLGLVRMSICMSADGRSTAIPDTEIDDFKKFRLSFLPTDGKPLNKPFVKVLQGVTNQVTEEYSLEAGAWDLHIAAFLEDIDDTTLETQENDPSAFDDRAAAVYDQPITVVSGKPTTVQAKLKRIIDGSGTGTFSWTIDFAPAVMALITNGGKAEMTINAYDSLNTTFTPVRVYLDQRPDSIETLPVGYYLLNFEVTADGYTITPFEILHVYQNMESKYQKTFTELNFPVTLLKRILSSWDNTKGEWVFDKGDGYPITKKHFGNLNGAGLDINGVDDTAIDFDKLTQRMNEITILNSHPTDLQELKDMIDVALISYAVKEGDFEISQLPLVDDVKNTLESYAKNGSTVTIDASDLGSTELFEVTIGSYKYSYEPPKLTGDLYIVGSLVEGFYRVNDDVTADTGNLVFDSNVSGGFEFEWRSAPDGAADFTAPPDPADPTVVWTTIGKRSASDTYTLKTAEIDQYVMAEAWRIGHFGSVSVLAAHIIGPVQPAQGSSNIDITLDPIDTFTDQDLRSKPISLAQGGNVTITATAKGNISKIQWYRSDGTPVGTGAPNLKVDSIVHDNRPGKHIVSLVAEIKDAAGNDVPGSMNVLIRVVP